MPKVNHGWEIVELPNRSENPSSNFVIRGEDIRSTLSHWFNEATPAEIAQLIVWHTHPAGNVGPSRTDLHSSRDNIANLVVALTSEGPKATVY